MRLGKAVVGHVAGLSSFGRGVGAGFVGLFTPLRTMRRGVTGVGRIGRDVIKGNQQKAALASMKLLGSAAGVTYATRVLSGRGLFRDRKGKKDILPFIPWV